MKFYRTRKRQQAIKLLKAAGIDASDLTAIELAGLMNLAGYRWRLTATGYRWVEVGEVMG